MNPIDPRRSERALLASVHRWARGEGWLPRWSKSRHSGCWTWTDGAWRPTRPPTGARRVTFDGRGVQVMCCHDAGWTPVATFRATSVQQAVDVLVALDILPAWLSSSWAACEDKYAEQIETLTEDLERARGAHAHVVAGWAERADVLTVGARIQVGGVA